jgi:NitT/TauT family transport system substrate-binding protein
MQGPGWRHETDISGETTATGFQYPGAMLMRIIQTLIVCCLAAWASFGMQAVCGGETVHPLSVELAFDRPINAGEAPVIVAITDGLFAAEGLSVTTSMTAGPSEVIARVASGVSEFAFVDLNALIRFRSQNSQPVKAVFVLFNKSPYAIVARKSRGIHVLSDLEGKTLGIADSDLSAGLWPALARQNGLHLEHIKQSRISAAVREPMLSAGQVDAVTGFSYQSAVNLRDRGVPADDLAVLRFADYGCDTYGFALIVNPDFAAKQPNAVKGFVRALIAGTNLTIRDEGHAVDQVLTRMDEGSRDLELERMHTVIRDNILTDEVNHNGLGGVDPARLERSIDQVGEGFKFAHRPQAADIFDDRFLPPRADRLIN